MSETERNRQLSLDFIDAIGRNDVPAIVAAYADDGRVTTMGNTLISGTFTRDQIVAAADQVLAMFPEGLNFTVHSIIAEGDRVAVEAESLGRHASGKTYNQKYHFLMHWRDGQLVHLKEYMDTEHVTDVLCGGQRPA
jgi:Ketosteroid isomerase-related protein